MMTALFFWCWFLISWMMASLSSGVLWMTKEEVSKCCLRDVDGRLMATFLRTMPPVRFPSSVKSASAQIMKRRRIVISHWPCLWPLFDMMSYLPVKLTVDCYLGAVELSNWMMTQHNNLEITQSIKSWTEVMIRSFSRGWTDWHQGWPQTGPFEERPLLYSFSSGCWSIHREPVHIFSYWAWGEGRDEKKNNKI